MIESHGGDIIYFLLIVGLPAIVYFAVKDTER